MNRRDAEKLLGGYATGTLTESERRALFEAALEYQDLFNALVDEEALRELLADPAARTHLLAALGPAARPKVVPLWRRPGLIGAAASLIVAATAGLAVLRSPEAMVPVLPQAAPEAPTGKGLATKAPATKAPARKALGAPAPPPPTSHRTVAPAPPVVPPPPRAGASQPGSDLPAARAIEAPAAAFAPVQTRAQPPVAAGQAAVAEKATSARTEDLLKAEPVAPTGAQAEHADRLGAAAAGVAGAELSEIRKAPAPQVRRTKTAEFQISENASGPAWQAETMPDGATRVTVLAPVESRVLLLQRRASGVVVVRPVEAGRVGARIRWWLLARPSPGEPLDLYVLNAPVADPAALPETGPVDGVRVRIPPPEKKALAR